MTAATRRNIVVGATVVSVLAAIVVLTGVTPERWVDVDEPKAASWLWRLSVSAADTAVLILAATLLVGPLRVLRGGRPTTHLPWRRTLGIWAGGVALLHVSLAVFVHARATRLWSNWLELSPLELVGGARGLANWLGLLQVAIVAMLLWLSRDEALRRLGGRTWKWLQRSAYVLVIAVAVHALLYHRVEQRIAAHRIPLYLVLGFVIAAQLAGMAVVLRRRNSSAT